MLFGIFFAVQLIHGGDPQKELWSIEEENFQNFPLSQIYDQSLTSVCDSLPDFNVSLDINNHLLPSTINLNFASYVDSSDQVVNNYNSQEYKEDVNSQKKTEKRHHTKSGNLKINLKQDEGRIHEMGKQLEMLKSQNSNQLDSMIFDNGNNPSTQFLAEIAPESDYKTSGSSDSFQQVLNPRNTGQTKIKSSDGNEKVRKKIDQLIASQTDKNNEICTRVGELKALQSVSNSLTARSCEIEIHSANGINQINGRLGAIESKLNWLVGCMTSMMNGKETFDAPIPKKKTRGRVSKKSHRIAPYSTTEKQLTPPIDPNLDFPFEEEEYTS